MSSPALEALREQIVSGMPNDTWCAEHNRWMFLCERAIAGVYWEILDTLKKQDSLEEVKRILESGELEIAKMRSEDRGSLNKHMEEWERNR